MLVPSPWNESFGLVAAEAMINGIPVLASNRGALLEIPSRYTPNSRIVPTAEEVEPWVQSICRLWDDQDAYRHASDAARECAHQWHPDSLGPRYGAFCRSVSPQPGPPLVPKEWTA